MKLMFAAIERASGIKITEFELRPLHSLRDELKERSKPEPTHFPNRFPFKKLQQK
jgi:hypothetical protein